MLADEIVEGLSKAKLFITATGTMEFFINDVDTAMLIKGLIAQWAADRKGFGPWIQEGDHWLHTHPDGIRTYHSSRGCLLLS